MAANTTPERTAVEDLVVSFGLPPTAAPPSPSEQNLKRGEVRLVPEKQVFYVAPHLECMRRPAYGPAFCYLISAPAAVGKTTLANYLHNRLACPGRTVLYVPLQKAKIGDRYLAGLLSEAFPTMSKEQLFNSLFSGQIVILFDGYDEVSMTTWQIEMNKRFTQEVVEDFTTHQFQGRPTVPCLVFLYRSVFSETGIFDDLDNLAAQYRVEFFDHNQRRDYLRKYLLAKGDASAPLLPLVDQFLQGFESRADSATSQADAFFGHAVVLSAFGDYLANQEEGNAFRLAQSLSAEGVSESASVAILRGIIETILDREVTKFPELSSLQPLAPFQGFDRKQQELILGELAARPADKCNLGAAALLVQGLGRKKLESSNAYAGLHQDMRQVVDQDYLENLRRKVELHPFLDVHEGKLVFKNPIYQEYYLAQYAAGQPEVPLSSIIATKAPSYFLALFLLALVENRNLTTYREATFYVLKLLSAACNGDEYQIHIDYDPGTGRWSAWVESDNLRAAPFVVGVDEVLTLELPSNVVLQNFSVDGKDAGWVCVCGPKGYSTTEPVLMTNGVISGAEVELDAVAFTFDTITLHTHTLSLTDRVSELNGLDTLNVDWNGAPKLQASDYAKNRWGKRLTGKEQAGTPEDLQRKLKKILLWFRKHGREDYGVYRPRFNTCALNKRRDEDAIQLADFLFSKGILKDGTLIVLNQDKLAKYGVHYVKQNQLGFGDGFSRLFDEWQASRKGQP